MNPPVVPSVFRRAIMRLTGRRSLDLIAPPRPAIGRPTPRATDELRLGPLPDGRRQDRFGLSPRSRWADIRRMFAASGSVWGIDQVHGPGAEPVEGHSAGIFQKLNLQPEAKANRREQTAPPSGKVS